MRTLTYGFRYIASSREVLDARPPSIYAHAHRRTVGHDLPHYREPHMTSKKACRFGEWISGCMCGSEARDRERRDFGPITLSEGAP